jgi:hypothetical protein
MLLCIRPPLRADEPTYRAAQHGRVGYRFEHIERIEYDDARPIRPRFDWGRLAGQRHLFTFGLGLSPDLYAGAVLGPAMYEVHNGEGESVEYDLFCLGLEGAWEWHGLPQYGVGGLVAGRGLVSTKDSGKITEVSRDAVTVDSRSELSWWELSLLAAVTHQVEALRLSAGLEYVLWSIEQEWSLTSGSVTTDLEPQDSLGVVLGGRYQCMDDLAVTFDITLGHQVSFRTGVAFDF